MCCYVFVACVALCRFSCVVLMRSIVFCLVLYWCVVVRVVSCSVVLAWFGARCYEWLYDVVLLFVYFVSSCIVVCCCVFVV